MPHSNLQAQFQYLGATLTLTLAPFLAKLIHFNKGKHFCAPLHLPLPNTAM